MKPVIFLITVNEPFKEAFMHSALCRETPHQQTLHIVVKAHFDKLKEQSFPLGLPKSACKSCD